MELLPFISNFSPEFYLAGGTATALQIRHRRSFDFDLMTDQDIHHRRIINYINRSGFEIEDILTQSVDELTIIINTVKVTFLSYHFSILADVPLDSYLLMPNLVQLSAMKAYALGRRSKWRDYVDLYFILKYHVSFEKTAQKAKELFDKAFNEKLFREQLTYYDDIDFSESVDFFSESESENVIKSYLTKLAIS